MAPTTANEHRRYPRRITSARIRSLAIRAVDAVDEALENFEQDVVVETAHGKDTVQVRLHARQLQVEPVYLVRLCSNVWIGFSKVRVEGECRQSPKMMIVPHADFNVYVLKLVQKSV